MPMSRLVTRRSFTLIAASLGLAAAGCGGRYRENVEPPVLTARVAQYAGADANAVSLRLELTAYNPNPFDLWADSLNATLTVAGQQVGVAHVTFAQVLPAGRPLPIVANVAIPRAGLAAMMQSPAAIAMGQAGMAVSAQGIPFAMSGVMELQGRRRRERMTVPFNVQGVFPAQAMMSLAQPGGAMMPPPGVDPNMAPPSSGGTMIGGPSNTN
jgi:hypothetical protein